MKRIVKKSFLITIVAFLAFTFFTIMVKIVNVKNIGPSNTLVGLASFNGKVSTSLGINMTWYKISDLLGIVVALLAASFGFLGLIQLIKRKNLFKVDYQILVLGVFYLMLGAFYLFFEVNIVNYRPVALEGILESSYPSSHTMLSLCILGSTIMLSKTYLKDKNLLRIILVVLCFCIMILLIVARLLSGLHWASDIIGGCLLSIALLATFNFMMRFVEYQIAKKSANKMY